jgi:DNA-binding YbaB/EbfC family protein
MKGFGNMQGLMKQAQQMQANMQKAQEELENETVTADVAGGMVEITMTGKKKITKVTLKPEAVDPDDIEMLEDLILSAVNSASEKADELSAGKMSSAGIPTGNMGGLL